jgi:hypothetical protein
MKKILVFIFSLVIGLCFSNFAYAEDEHIESFRSDITIQKNSQVEVKETIKYYFPSPKHGIFRYIPEKYSVRNSTSLTGSYNVYLTINSVSTQKDDGTLTAVPYEKSQSGGNLNLKIGDPNQEVSGPVTYIIDYQALRAINFTPKDNAGQDEFYWNMTGNGWEVPINAAEAVIHFPTDIDSNTWKFGCYTGELGSLATECLFDASSHNSVDYKSKWELPAKSGLTIVAGFPKGTVIQPTKSEDIALALRYNFLIYLFLLIPLVAFVVLFVTWFLKGRDPKGQGTIIPFYGPPDNLTPVEIGTLVDEKADLKDISSCIIDFAVKGYVKIREVVKPATLGIFKHQPDYEIQLLRADDAIPKAEQKIFEAIFVPESKINRLVKLSDLQKTFPAQLSDIKTSVYTELVQKGYFPKNPERVRNAYLSVGAIVAFLGVILFINNLGLIAAGSLILTGGMIAIFGLFMPHKTLKGVNVYENILGLKEYMTVAEADRIKFHNAPAKKPEHFEKLLPYAMVLGVETEWAKQFEGIYQHPPSWYEGSSLDNFSALYLANSLVAFRDTANSAMGMRTEGGGAAGGLSGFGGGGFSGGGFGGGGGGSW